MVKIGLIGSGFWADAMYLPALNNFQHGTVFAIAGNSEDSTLNLAEKWDIPIRYWGEDAAEKLIHRQPMKLDAVIICSPTNTHYAYTKKALEAGLHVLCEKPLATSAVETAELCKLAADRGLLNMVGYTYSWLPEIQRLIEQQRFCDTFRLKWTCGFMHNVIDPADKFNKLKGNRLFADVGSHMIHMTNTMFGEVKSVRWLREYKVSSMREAPGFEASELGGKIELEYHRGTKGTIEVITDQPQPGPYNMKHRFEFSKGNIDTVYQNFWLPEDIADYKKVFRQSNSMARCFCMLIKHGITKTSRNFEDAHRVQKVLDALYSVE